MLLLSLIKKVYTNDKLFLFSNIDLKNVVLK